MSRVLRRPKALEDVLDVWEYIAEDSLVIADRWVEQLDQQLYLLSTQPMLGRARDELSPGIRSFPFGRYVLFYEPLPDGIDLVRVLHAARDLSQGLPDQ